LIIEIIGSAGAGNEQNRSIAEDAAGPEDAVGSAEVALLELAVPHTLDKEAVLHLDEWPVMNRHYFFGLG
jgi:hypothetical protein